MPREVYRNDYSIDELKNIKNGKCWCGKPRSEFNKRMRVYCCVKHREEWYKRTETWSNFRDRFIGKIGFVCKKCKTSKELMKLNVKRDLKEWYVKIKKNPKAMKVVEEERISFLYAIEENYKDAMNDDKMIDRAFGFRYRDNDIVPQKPAESSFVESCFEVDHIYPVAAGGPMWDEKNLQVLCNPCHKQKTKVDLILIKNYKRKLKGKPVTLQT